VEGFLKKSSRSLPVRKPKASCVAWVMRNSRRGNWDQRFERKFNCEIRQPREKKKSSAPRVGTSRCDVKSARPARGTMVFYVSDGNGRKRAVGLRRCAALYAARTAPARHPYQIGFMKLSIGNLIVLLLVSGLIHCSVVCGATVEPLPAYPLKKSVNGRYLV